MQEELAIEIPGLTADETTAAETPARTKLRTPRQVIAAYVRECREGIICAVLTVSIVGALYGSAFGALAIWHYNGRVQATERAKMMDGGTYLLTPTAWTLLGDTIMRVENERGEELGWVALHDTNPLTPDVNPLLLAFSEKKYDPMPSRMKVRAHYRPQAWATHGDYAPAANENYTGDFLEFERLGQPEVKRDRTGL